MLTSSLQDPELEISARTEMQISGTEGGGWHSSLFDSFFLSGSLANTGQHGGMRKQQTHTAEPQRRGPLARHVLSKSIFHT